jgi:hypothetical protein
LPHRQQGAPNQYQCKAKSQPPATAPIFMLKQSKAP